MQQPNHDNSHSRKQFQVDRIAFFSDAVIAIAITLMVLEVKIPPLGHNTLLKEIVGKYWETFLEHILALFICFYTIGRIWIKHHELYEHITNYNTKLIKRNLYFLFSVILLPVSINFLYSDDSPMQLKLCLFFGNLAVCNILYYCMLLVVYNPKNGFVSLQDKHKMEKTKGGTLFIAGVFLAAFVLAAFNISWFYVPFIVMPTYNLLKRVFGVAKKYFQRNGPDGQPEVASKMVR